MGTRFTGTMIMRKTLYFYLSVGSDFFYLNYNKKRALNISTASIILFLTSRNLNFLALITYNPCLFRVFLRQFFYVFQDHGIALKIIVFIDFTKKIR